MNALNIHDIKGLSAIPDLSFYLFIVFILLGTLILGTLIFFLFKYLKNRKHDEKKSLEILKNIDFTDAKKAAYLITKHGRVVVGHERDKKLLEDLLEDLSHYKYKKRVEPINDTCKHKFQIFMDAL